MFEVLCQCENYDKPHTHVRPTFLNAETGTWDTYVTYPDGERAKIGDVLVHVNWEEQASLLAHALDLAADELRQREGTTPLIERFLREVLADWKKAREQDNHALKENFPGNA